jgi:putative tryptophan/tyrosine transport system substrate-binding protein
MKTKILFYALPALILAVIHIAEAQQPSRMYRIGVLAVENPPPGLVENFREGLQDLGYIEGRNIAIESRNAQGRSEQLAALADELVRLKVDVILTVNTPAAVAAKNATTTIPIVITRVADPVKSGLVASLSHPGGNLTGLSFMPDDIGTKQLELLKEIRPSISRVAVLWHADNPGASIVVKQMEHASSQLGLRFLRLPVRHAQDFLEALGAATRGRAEALFVVDDAMVTKHRFQILDLAARRSLPVVSFYKEFVEAGGLFAYGASPPAIYRRAAALVDKILKGAKPADLPVEQPVKFEFIINLKAAKQIGLTIPQSVLVRADKVLK